MNDLRARLGLAQTRLKCGQTAAVRKAAMEEIERLREEIQKQEQATARSDVA